MNQENVKEKKNIFKDRKNIVILILSITIVIMLVFIVIALTFSKIIKPQKIDASNYSSYELVDMFNKEGYHIEIYTSGEYTIYVNLENSKEGITIQRIYNNLIGNQMTFDDDSINEEMADLIDTSENDTVEKEQQYEAFENWLKKYNITKLQISNMLDTYYDLHKDEAENLDEIIDGLLNY